MKVKCASAMQNWKWLWYILNFVLKYCRQSIKKKIRWKIAITLENKTPALFLHFYAKLIQTSVETFYLLCFFSTRENRISQTSRIWKNFSNPHRGCTVLCFIQSDLYIIGSKKKRVTIKWYCTLEQNRVFNFIPAYSFSFQTRP